MQSTLDKILLVHIVIVHTCGNIVLRTADLMGGAENLGESGEVGWEELVSEAPPTPPSLGDSV